MANPTTTDPLDEPTAAARERCTLRDRHASALARLMEERQDLRGTHAFADMVDDSLRWSA
ncbi:MAG TPA: hypothetical protein VFR99_00645 [Marmoricola sp.]|nr:hypothetical protein [Marmoricola sp.]